MKFLTIIALIIITILPACETSDHTHPLEEHTHLEHTHPIPEHFHNQNLDDPLPDPEQPDDTNLNNVIKDIKAINLMNDIVTVTHEDIELAKALFEGKAVTVKAPVEAVELLFDIVDRKSIHLYYLKNIRNITFYIVTYPPLKRTLEDDNPEVLFKPGQAYTITLLIERIGRPRWGHHGWPVIQTKLLEDE